MNKKLLYLGALIITIFCQCEPFGLRIYYGDVLTDPSSSSKAIVYFNTRTECNQSYLTLTLSDTQVKKILCDTLTVQASGDMNFYTTYIHTCPIDDITFGLSFSYAVFGKASNDLFKLEPHRFGLVTTKLTDPRDINQSVRFAVTADWSPLITNPLKLKDSVPLLATQIQEQQADALLILGDTGYDLDSNYGENYENFMIMFEEVAKGTPSIHTPGNHERYTLDDELLFKTGFKTYGVEEEMAVGLYLGNTFLIPFDPYRQVYKYKVEKSTYDALLDKVRQGKASGRYVVPQSHYCMTCSSQFTQCDRIFQTIQPFFDMMVDEGITFYLGAHTHVYERLYPYLKGEFIIEEGPYRSNESYLITIIEGVAGSQSNFMNELEDGLKPYTARYTLKETGFGIITSRPNYISYAHYSTQSEDYVDVVTIQKTSASEHQLKGIEEPSGKDTVQLTKA